ncbi:MAG: IS66 family insertion sequence element accessory protein TnpA [Bacillota bacterium]
MANKELGTIWAQRFLEFEASGQSIAAWCTERLLRENQFYYWRKKLRSCQTEKEQPVKWVPMEVEFSKQARHAADSISVHVGQVTVEIKKGFNQHLLREIVQVLQSV